MPPSAPVAEDALDGLIDAAMSIAAQEGRLRAEMKAAILRSDPGAALLHACALVGIDPPDLILQMQDSK